MRLRACRFAALNLSRNTSAPSVMIQPGETVLTRTPFGPSYLEMDLL
ncbi:hypothetical protein [Brevundimonas vesicularis]